MKNFPQYESPDPYDSEELLSSDTTDTAELFSEENSVDCESYNSVPETGLFRKLMSDPKCKYWASRSLIDRNAEVIKQRKIYLSKTATPEEKERALYEIFTVVFWLLWRQISRFAGGHTTAVVDVEDYLMIALAEVTIRLPDFCEEDVFSSYVYLHVQHAIIKAVADSQGLSRYFNEKVTLVKRAKARLEAAGKKYITETDIAILLPNESIQTISFCLDYINYSYADIDNFGESLSAHEETPEEALIKAEKDFEIQDAIVQLPEDVATVIRMAYGFTDDTVYNLRQISEITGIPYNTVRKHKLLGEKQLARILGKRGYSETAEQVKKKAARNSSPISLTDLTGESNEDLTEIDFSDKADW